jgi:hypothetical protein
MARDGRTVGEGDSETLSDNDGVVFLCCVARERQREREQRRSERLTSNRRRREALAT